MRFLYGDLILNEIKEVVRRSGKLSVAVAYWGEDAAEHTGIADRPDRKNVRVICDLLSGACNPSEIRRLKRLGVQVRKLSGLHAKVWINGDRVIVGSANASTSGLVDDDGHNMNIEAGLAAEDAELSRELQEWFEWHWCHHASEIDKEDLRLADRRHKQRKRPFGRGDTEVEPNESDEVDFQMLRKTLVDRVVAAALELWQSNPASDITDRAVARCRQDPVWWSDYNTYLGGDPVKRHKQKERINPQFGRNIRAAIGADAAERTARARSGVLSVYTPLFTR